MSTLQTAKKCYIIPYYPAETDFIMAARPLTEALRPAPLPDFSLNPLTDRSLPITRAWLQEYSCLEAKHGLPAGVSTKDIIRKTKNREVLTRAEIFGWVNDFVTGAVPDYQMSSWMAYLTSRDHHGDFERWSDEETIDLTLAMAASGDLLDLDYLGVVADKHSSGGVGDKTSLVVVPLVAACGVRVGKMSGRGLGHTGGTLDKLDSIPGFDTRLSMDQFLKITTDVGLVITGQTGELAPADGKMYALRDVTETVDCIPLIAASIMSKKIASGANTLVLDVTVGSGAFMKSVEDAERLAKIMVNIGKSLGMNVIAEISDMDQPRGLAVGNSLEVLEAIKTLKLEGPPDFTEHCIETAARIVHLAGQTDTYNDAKAMVISAFGGWSEYHALEKFREMIIAQGGNGNVVDRPEEILKIAKGRHKVRATQDGYLNSINAEDVGLASMKLGGGRVKKDDEINYSVGVLLAPETKLGKFVHEGDVLFEIVSDDPDTSDQITNAKTLLESAIKYNETSLVFPLMPMSRVIR